MDDLLLMVLFAYTGAVAELVYRHFATDKAYFKEVSGLHQTARCFFLSALVTVLTGLILSPMHPMSSLTEWTVALKTTDLFWYHLLVSFALSILTGILWYAAIEKAIYPLMSWIHTKQGKSAFTTSSCRWTDLTETDLARTAAAIYKGGRMICCGIIDSMPLDFHRDPDFLLMYSAEVAADLALPKEQRITGSILRTYYDAASDTTVEIIDATYLIEKLNEENP